MNRRRDQGRTLRWTVFDVGQYLPRLGGVPLVMIEATSDRLSPLAEAQKLYALAPEPKRLWVVTATGHHFEGGEADFYAHLDEAIGAPVGSGPVFHDTQSG